MSGSLILICTESDDASVLTVEVILTLTVKAVGELGIETFADE